MYVWARFLRVVATTPIRGKTKRPTDESRLTFRCLPFDIDPNIHLNNARYLMLADLGRFDLFIRTGIWDAARENNWVPMMGGVQAVYVRQIKLWRKFHLISSFDTWSGTQVVGRHRFELDDGRTAATLLTTAGFFDRGARKFVTTETMAKALGVSDTARDPDKVESAYLNSHGLIRADIKAKNAPLEAERRQRRAREMSNGNN